VGVRFQAEPNTPPSVIILHVRMWDQENVLQQQALGIVGVNLVSEIIKERHLFGYKNPDIAVQAL
jgi:hypothetical protein